MIVCKNLTKKFNDKIIFENLDYYIGNKGIYSITGSSGCGKTTLSRIIMKLEEYSSGNIIYDKNIVFSAMFPENRLIPNLSALDNINYVLMDKDRSKKILELMKMKKDEDKLPRELSNGMKRRVALGRALGYESDLLVLDEPFNGLDDKLKEYIGNLLIEESKKRSILLIDHDINLLKSISKDILYFN